MERMNLKDYINATVTADRTAVMLSLLDSKTDEVIDIHANTDALLPSKEMQKRILMRHAQNVWMFDVTVIEAVTYDEDAFESFVRDNGYGTDEPEFD